MKKVISIMLAVCMTLMLLPATALAASISIVTILGSKMIFANGNAIILVAGTTPDYTCVYLDNDRDGQIDAGVDLIQTISGATGSGDETGYDLKSYYVLGGNESTPLAGDTKITMLGGKITNIFGGGYGAAATVSGSTNITVNGGWMYNCMGGGYSGMVGSTNVTVNGGTIKLCILGGGLEGTVSGSTNVTVNGGTFEDCFGGGYDAGWTAVTTNVTVNGGTITHLYGGGRNGNGNGTVSGSANVTVNGGLINYCFGGGLNTPLTVGTNVTVNGGTITTELKGGGLMPHMTVGSTSIIVGGGIVSGDIDAVSGQLGTAVELKDIKVAIEIAKSAQETVKIVENSAKAGKFTVIAPAMEFNIRCSYNGKTIEVNKFNAYVERTIAIPEGVDKTKITTGVIIDSDGTVRHVPTQVIIIDGKYYAKINSLTNSTYSVISNPVTFTDAENHWAKKAISDMGSKMVISGVGNHMFEPDRDITRAEFAAIVIRALGLKPGMGSNPFDDVKTSDWYSNYIKTAVEYKIISGYDSGKFGPNDKIDREQAMAMIARAMKITGMKAELKDSDVSSLLANYTDGAVSSDYAKTSIAACLKTGIITGRSNNTIEPKNYITRAEVAQILHRLLQKSNLI